MSGTTQELFHTERVKVAEWIESRRQTILNTDERNCFIDRERLIGEFEKIANQYAGEVRYAECFRYMMERMGTPIDDRDRLLGWMNEALPVPEDQLPDTIGLPSEMWKVYSNWKIVCANGHHTADYETIMKIGLEGVVKQSEEAAQRIGTAKAGFYAQNARTCLEGVKNYATRYAAAARARAEEVPELKSVLLRAAAAAEQVPHGPATDFVSAVQSCWFSHLILSCCVGGRDFAFGRMDQYLLPYYRADRAAGRITREEALDLFTDLCLKCNQIASNCRGVHLIKPVPSMSSHQYIVLAGVDHDGNEQSNELSWLFLEAARRVRLTEPVLHVRMHPEVESDLVKEAVAASFDTQGQVQFSNDRLIPGSLIAIGIDEVDAWNYTASACSRTDCGPTHADNEHFVSPVFWLTKTLEKINSENRCPESFEELKKVLTESSDDTYKNLIRMFSAQPEPTYPADAPFNNGGGIHFHFDSLYIRDCASRALNQCEGGARYRMHQIHHVGMATAIDLVMTVKTLVYDHKSHTLAELMKAAADNFEGHTELHREIMKLPKFGNDLAEVDEIGEWLGRMFIERIDAAEKPMGHLFLPSFYSLNTHEGMGRHWPATLDGRKAGITLSENQSPTYGADTHGCTAMMKSFCRLPFERAGSGAMNIKFMRNTPPEKVYSLIQTYFGLGGSMVGLTIVDRGVLEEAHEHPERFRNLQVRMHGFSETFVMLPDFEQIELISRTPY